MPVGHDIVWTGSARCKGKAADARFLEKVCTPAEQQYIRTSADADAALWLIWSAKEAAYKLSCFLGNRAKFSWKKFEVHPGAGGNTVQSKVRFQQSVFFCRTFIRTSHICSVAMQCNDFEKILHGIAPVTRATSAAAHQYARESIAKHLLRDAEALQVIKDEYGIPSLRDNLTGMAVPLSLSHDGPFVSFAIHAPDGGMINEA
jgi:phosphopantetheinyl transferase (holo-ACP synthase)